MGSDKSRFSSGMTSLNLALIGYGKMGQMVERLAEQKGHHITAKIAPSLPSKMITSQALNNSDICIDFSHPSCVIDNILHVAKAGKSIVVGTTGWSEHLPKVNEIVQKHSIGLLYAPNFSLGVSLFMMILSEAASLINKFPNYDVALVEEHHRQKADSPSGTAKTLLNILQKNMDRKNDIPLASVRYGSVPGTHTISFDSPEDTITLTHTARNREGFAAGAIRAAEWLVGRKGLFTLNDMIGE